MRDVLAAISVVGAAIALMPASAMAADVSAGCAAGYSVDSVLVTGRRRNLVGEAISASEG